jgi:hypothetical protein
MSSKKTSTLTALTVVLAAGAIGFGVNAAFGDDTGPDKKTLVVDWSVPQHQLLDDVLALDAKRSAGGQNFSYVPKALPGGLRRLILGSPDAPIVDVYQTGDEHLQVLVEFAKEPTETCHSITKDPGAGICVREDVLDSAPEDARFKNMTVYVTQVGTQAATFDATAAGGIRRFWATAEMVPLAQASWYADLLAQAKAAPKKQLG